MRLTTRLASLTALTALATLPACSDDEGVVNEEEVITTVTLDFTPDGGGAKITAAFDDPDGDGGNAPTIDPIALTSGTVYTVTVRFQNKLETPAGEITEEVRDESDQHQVFFTGSAVNGPATNTPNAPLTHAYADTDAGGLPVGLSNTITAATGTGELIVTLRHLPPINGTAAKVAELAAQVKSGGLAALPGETDANVTFAVSVP